MHLPLPDKESAEFGMFRLFELTPDLVCIASREGYFKKVNRAVVEKLGYPEEELYRRPIISFIHPDDQEVTRRRRAELLNGAALTDFDNRYIKKNGETIWLHWTSIYIPERAIVFAIAKDVTERRQKERDIEAKYRKFESLASHFKSRLEKDKKHLANELHEDLAQMASVVKMNLSSLSDTTPVPAEAVRRKIEDSLMIMDLLIEAIRRLSHSISPNMLDDLGLSETLSWICEEFTRINGIPCYFEDKFEGAALPHEIQLDFFRICQEALNNVMSHAAATAVWITLEAVGEMVCLSVTDNGRGFEPDLAQMQRASGLDNIRKIAASVHGELVVDSEPGRGTRVSVQIARRPS